ncbi:MAG: hypothetical protein MHMPM18_000179 [Marteilia pararefringens]
MEFDKLRKEFSHKIDELVSKYRDTQLQAEQIFTKKIFEENAVPKLQNFIEKKEFFEKITTTPQIFKHPSNLKSRIGNNPQFLQNIKSLESFYTTNSSEKSNQGQKLPVKTDTDQVIKKLRFVDDNADNKENAKPKEISKEIEAKVAKFQDSSKQENNNDPNVGRKIEKKADGAQERDTGSSRVLGSHVEKIKKMFECSGSLEQVCLDKQNLSQSFEASYVKNTQNNMPEDQTKPKDATPDLGEVKVCENDASVTSHSKSDVLPGQEVLPTDDYLKEIEEKIASTIEEKKKRIHDITVSQSMSSDQHYNSVLEQDMPKFYDNHFEEKFSNIVELFENRIKNLSSKPPLPPTDRIENFKQPAAHRTCATIPEEATEQCGESTAADQVSGQHEVKILSANAPTPTSPTSYDISSTDMKSSEVSHVAVPDREESEQILSEDVQLSPLKDATLSSNSADQPENTSNSDSLTFYSASDRNLDKETEEVSFADSTEQAGKENTIRIDNEDEKEEDKNLSDEKVSGFETNGSGDLNPSSNQFCSTFTDDLRRTDSSVSASGTTAAADSNSIDNHLEEQYIKYNNFIEAINEEANNFNSYINNFQISNSREIYINNLKHRLEVQKNINNQLVNFEQAAIQSKKNLILEQSTMFSFLKFKTKMNIVAIENHLDYCKNEMNPILSLIKGNGILSICDVALGCNRLTNHSATSGITANSGSTDPSKEIGNHNKNSPNQYPNHILTAFFEYDGNVTFISPVLINNPQDICEFMQKFTFTDLPSDFKIRFVIAELCLPEVAKISRSFAKNFLKKVKGYLSKRTKKIVKRTKTALKSKEKSRAEGSKVLKRSNIPTVYASSSGATGKIMTDSPVSFEIIGEMILDKHSVAESNFSCQIANSSGSSTRPTTKSRLLNGSVQMKLDIIYNVDLDFSGQMAVMCIDKIGDKYWVDNYVSLTNGKLFFWTCQTNAGTTAGAPGVSQTNNSTTMTVGQNKNATKLNEVVLLSNVRNFVGDASHLCMKEHSIMLEITRNWTASDRTTVLQKMIGNMLVRQLFLMFPNAKKHSEWVRNLNIVIKSHKEWNN